MDSVGQKRIQKCTARVYIHIRLAETQRNNRGPRMGAKKAGMLGRWNDQMVWRVVIAGRLQAFR